MQEYTVNIKKWFTSLPPLSKNLNNNNLLIGCFLEEKLCIFFCVYLTPSVTSSGILYNSQLAEGTEP